MDLGSLWFFFGGYQVLVLKRQMTITAMERLESFHIGAESFWEPDPAKNSYLGV